MSKADILLLTKMVKVYEEALYEIKDIDNLEDAQAIAFVALNEDFED